MAFEVVSSARQEKEIQVSPLKMSIRTGLIFGGIVIKWQNDLKREELKAGSDQKSLGTGELKEMIQDAMEEAISPLEDRLELIEQNMRRLPEHVEKGAAEEPQ